MPCPTTTIVGTAVCAWVFGVVFEAAAVVRGSLSEVLPVLVS